MVLELEMVPDGAVYFMDAGFHVSSMVKAVNRLCQPFLIQTRIPLMRSLPS